jgi:hypothetical protein
MLGVSRTAVVCAGLLAMHSGISPGQQLAAPDYRADPRLERLRGFFNEYQAPAYVFAADFLAAADRHGLDWRLLPSVSILESGGGKAFMRNNILGWDSCRTGFSSVPAGVETVAARLAHSDLYKNKDLNHKLAAYNPRQNYPARVRALMQRLGPDPALTPLRDRRFGPPLSLH